MFRIRRIYDDITAGHQDAIAQAQAILRAQFPGLAEAEIAKLPQQLHNPLAHRFRATLFVADDWRGRVKGFALLLHAPDLHFAYLDFIAAATHATGGGIGGALYERVREDALALGAVGLFLECLPDDPALAGDGAALKQNRARLRFYERYGARPIINTAYETPVGPEGGNTPHLVFDDLGQERPLRRAEAQAIVRAILERKYGNLCPPEYIEMVVESFQDDPIRLRPPKYLRKERPIAARPTPPPAERIALVVNDQHEIHHVRDRGYLEAPVRVRSILRELQYTDLFERVEPQRFPERHITAVHDAAFVDYLRTVCEKLNLKTPLYPYVFPLRNVARPPKDLELCAGYYCIDTFTPLNRNAYMAARRAVDCALTAAQSILAGRRLAYALVRPPGHHAERRVFGGFCYFNSAAIAAHYLSAHGTVALLDVDYHHGNGQQDIFYERADVLTISLHGHPRIAYPYFSGFADEKGAGAGMGYNVNYPLPAEVNGEQYRAALGKALARIRRFRPRFLVVCLGLDPAKGDPTGSWSLNADDFAANGRLIGGLHLPTLVVQEGGYRSRVLGIHARHFFSGLWEGSREPSA